VNRTTFAGLALAAALIPGAALAKVKVAASINDLASIASSVGGDQIEVFSIARPTNDVHRVEVLPSYMVKVSRANLYLKVGLGLDQWADGIIDGSRNDKLQLVDCSTGVNVLDKPTKVDASMGDVHPFGNPHYWLDPRNGAVVAHTIADALAKADPAHAADFQSRADAFAKQAEAAWQKGKAAADAMPSHEILTYHASWVYFANAYGFQIMGTVEPVPGIPPTAKHLADLVALVKARKIPLLLQEPYFSDDAGKFLTREAGLRVVVSSPSCDAPDAGSYLAHFQTLIDAFGGKAANASTP
jgi:zinc/manganese transport system substrate-binding protein